MPRTETHEKPRLVPNSEVSELGKKLRAIRKKIEADPSIKLLSRKEILKEVENRRTGYAWEENEY